MALKIIQNPKTPKLKEALYILRFGLQDVRTRASLIEFNVVDLLMNVLSEQLLDITFNPSFFSHDLFGCLKILAQCDDFCRQKIGQDHATLLKLLKGMWILFFY